MPNPSNYESTQMPIDKPIKHSGLKTSWLASLWIIHQNSDLESAAQTLGIKASRLKHNLVQLQIYLNWKVFDVKGQKILLTSRGRSFALEAGEIVKKYLY